LVPALFPEFVYPDVRCGLSSCSAAEALERPGPFVNPTLANHALALLARMFRYGTISYRGAFVGLSWLAGMQALRIDTTHWQRLRKKARRGERPKQSALAPTERSHHTDQA